MANKIVCYPAEVKPIYPNTCGEQRVIDLGLYMGKRYILLTDGIAFPKQPKGVSIKPADFTNSDVRKYLKTESPLAKQVDRETQDKIRQRYSLEDELKALRTGDKEYRDFVEKTVVDGRALKEEMLWILNENDEVGQ